jgi:hypothetical protein
MKTFLPLLIIIISNSINAQIEQSTLLLGGGISASTQNYNFTQLISFENSNYSFKMERDALIFSFTPQVGYFVMERFAAGIRGGISIGSFTYTQEDTPDLSSSIFSYEAGPFI